MSLPSLVRPVTGRAVHLRITPRPSNLGESREVLRLISQFGEVEYFKNLRYDPLPAFNSALVIFRDEDAAQTCLKRSPLRFRMGKAGTQTDAFGETEIQDARIFQVTLNPARANFRDLVNASHFHGPFAIDSKRAAQRELAQKVPLKGLSDVNWRAKEKPWHVLKKERMFDGTYRESGVRKTLREIWREGQPGNEG